MQSIPSNDYAILIQRHIMDILIGDKTYPINEGLWATKVNT